MYPSLVWVSFTSHKRRTLGGTGARVSKISSMGTADPHRRTQRIDHITTRNYGLGTHLLGSRTRSPRQWARRYSVSTLPLPSQGILFRDSRRRASECSQCYCDYSCRTPGRPFFCEQPFERRKPASDTRCRPPGGRVCALE